MCSECKAKLDQYNRDGSGILCMWEIPVLYSCAGHDDDDDDDKLHNAQLVDVNGC